MQRVIDFVLSLLIAASLLLFAAAFVHVNGITNSWPMMQLHHIGDPIVGGIAGWLPPPAKRYAPLLLAVIIYAIMLISDRLFAGARRAVISAKAAQGNKKKGPPTAASVESERARAQLYKEYEQIEKALKDAKRRRCAFLSVDVVGSTSIKSGESEIAITSAFRAYEDLLRRTFKATRAWKDSWTPDGVMVCFVNLADAIKAGQSILQQLPAFNERSNRMKAKFEVRCGVNEGEIVIFEDSAIEKLVEQTIDVAGHMQKYATPGTLWVSSDVYDALQDRAGFRATGQEVDGYATYEWSPQPADQGVSAPKLAPEKANG
ncbi:MAG TPA: adenylate/guanylate cyclase domain-containing protein [Candidatus Cybelea sp.]|nr:adenylate/guanylate cyclase domain-containing protein [Candidatus Cybelea sp.]